jgi:lipopolysaccharide export system permease protein
VFGILQRHIFWSVLTACAAAAGLLVFVLMFGNALKELLGFMLSGQMPFGVFLKLLLLLVPYAAMYALPGGVLTGVLLVLGRMSAQNEVTAMRAAGLGLGFVARPILVLAALGVVASLGVNCHYMPRARLLYKQTLQDAVRAEPLRLIVPRTFVRDFPGVVVFVDRKNGNTVEDCWVALLDGQSRVKALLRAESGRVEYDAAENKLAARLFNVTTELRNEKDPEDFSEPGLVSRTEEVPLDLPLDNILGTRSVRQKLAWMTLPELLKARKAEEAKWAETGPERSGAWMQASMTIHEKISSAFGVLAFAVLAVPLGIRVSRRETSANLLVAALLWLAYYLCTMFIGWLDKVPSARPDLLQWAVPAAFLGLGLFLFRGVGRA